jgi:hypothetical protein
MPCDQSESNRRREKRREEKRREAYTIEKLPWLIY